MKINSSYIQSLNPCKDRLNNYLKHYEHRHFSVVEFLNLEHITYDDKIWVWKKFTTIPEAALFGLKCAESVLDKFESRYPNDARPRNALVAVKNWIASPTEENKQKCRAAADAAAAAAAAAYAAAAYAAAAYAAAAYAAAAYAADAAAYVAYAAAAAAAYAAAAYAADAAAYAADAAAYVAYAAADAAAAYAAAAYAADAAAYAADAAAYVAYAAADAAAAYAAARQKQQNKNLEFLIEIYQGQSK